VYSFGIAVYNMAIKANTHSVDESLKVAVYLTKFVILVHRQFVEHLTKLILYCKVWIEVKYLCVI